MWAVQGGIIDDTIVCNAAEGYLFVVVNAGNKHIDLEHMQKIKDEFSGDVKIEYIEDRSLLALQGKAAADILSNYVSVDLSQQSFMSSQVTTTWAISLCANVSADPRSLSAFWS